jgi:hypothetical protein
MNDGVKGGFFRRVADRFKGLFFMGRKPAVSAPAAGIKVIKHARVMVRSKYMPHNGAQECARRMLQLARHII